MLKCAEEVLNIIIIIIITCVMWSRIVHLNVCSIWEYVPAFFARLQFTIQYTVVPLWCSDHHHQQQHHQYHHHHHRQYYHNHLIRITVILKVISQNVRFWVKPQLSKLGQLTLDRTLVTSQPDLASNCPNLSHKCARIFLNYRMDTFP